MNVEERYNKTMLPRILLLVIIMGMLGISFYYFYNAMTAFSQGDVDDAFNNALLGSIGMGVSLYVTYILRKRKVTQKPAPKVITTVECKKCGFKSLNKFTDGDFIFKSVGNCQKCDEPMLISAIYAEAEKTKR